MVGTAAPDRQCSVVESRVFEESSAPKMVGPDYSPSLYSTLSEDEDRD